METIYEVRKGPHKGFLGTVQTQIILKNGSQFCEVLHAFNGPTVLITVGRQFVFESEVEEGKDSRWYRIDLRLMEGTQQVLIYHTSEQGLTYLRHGMEELQLCPVGPRLVVRQGNLGAWEFANAWKDSETKAGILGYVTSHEQSEETLGDLVSMFLAVAAPVLLGSTHSIETTK